MGILEISVIAFCVLVVGGVFGSYLYKKIKHLPTGECAECAKGKRKKASRLVEEYHQVYGCKNCQKKIKKEDPSL